MRAVFFCNEHFGLGHLRRSLAIAGALVETEPTATAVVVTGSRASGSVPAPRRVETLQLPPSPTDRHTAWKMTHANGTGAPRMPSEAVRALRAERSLAAVRELRPQVTAVDYLPTGRADELLPALEWLRGTGGCLTVLGLREVDDAPATLDVEWSRERVEAVRRLYDLVLVYGPEMSGDVRVRRLRAAGVEVQHVELVAAPAAASPPADLPCDYLLATAGGGIDGYGVLAAVLDALRMRPLPVATLIVAGPMMPAEHVERLRARAAGLDVRVERSRADLAAVMAGARAVVAMAGYNTVAELVQTAAPAVLVPRTEPRAEQLLRARMLEEAGRAIVVPCNELAADRLREALDEALSSRRPIVARPRGARQAAEIIAAISRSATGSRRSATHRPTSRERHA
ncbi:MAG: hypothetical protein QOG41_2080 [Thermoleophilaceae bacterium]|nr:hypothetical protein [Thermoleophilaceae bacterium]